MKFKTNTNIDVQNWTETGLKFTREPIAVNGEVLFPKNIISSPKLPENTVKSDKGIISINITQPLLKGFKGLITYTQTYFETVSFENAPDKEELRYKDILVYEQTIPYQAIKLMIEQLEASGTIPTNLVGLERLQYTIEQLILMDIVTHQTFGLLNTSDWTLID